MNKPLPLLILVCLLLVSAGCTETGTKTDASPSGVLPISSYGDMGRSGSGNLTVSFIDVGQGDSILLRSPEGKTLLIDAGPTDAGSGLVSYLKSLGISRLDAIVITHPHEDHIGGMQAVLAAFPVGEIYDSGIPTGSKIYENLLDTIDAKKIPFSTLTRGDTIPLDPNLTITVLNPPKKLFDDVNENSVVLRVEYGKESFLFTGDAGIQAENAMHMSGDDLGANVLKIGHHGSSSLTSARFLNDVSPQVAVVGVGKDNPYGHPANSTMKRLSAREIPVYETALSGTVVITTDGSGLAVSAGGSE